MAYPPAMSRARRRASGADRPSPTYGNWLDSNGRAWSGRQPRPGRLSLRDTDATGDLAVGLPIGALGGEEGVVGGGLDVAVHVDGAGGDAVLPGRWCAPVEAPERPGE